MYQIPKNFGPWEWFCFHPLSKNWQSTLHNNCSERAVILIIQDTIRDTTTGRQEERNMGNDVCGGLNPEPEATFVLDDKFLLDPPSVP